MYDFFVKLLNMSLAASIIILVIVVLRLLLKKAPRNIICFLWVLVALRLILPFSIQSNLSVYNMMPSSAGTQGQIEYFQYNGKTEKPKVEFSVPALVDDNASPDSMTVGEHTSDLYLPPVISIWLAGVCVMLLYAIGSYLYLRKKVGASIPRHDGLKMSDDISTPFILGILKPVIYIPSGMDEKTLHHVVAHEEAHIKRRDHWWKPFGFLLLAVYWFNPLCWIAYVLLCRDIEMACDEKVIRELDNNDKAAYSQALLNCSFPRRRIAACPLAFGEVGVKERVKSVLNYKKPAFWIIIVAVIACIAVAVCFLTNPKAGNNTFRNIQISWAKTLDMRSNEPVSRDLNIAQIDELESRLSMLKIGKEDDDFAGLTPFYSLSAYSSQTGQFMIAGYDLNGNHYALMLDGKYYRIKDTEFVQYLSNVCAGNDVSQAVEMTKWDCSVTCVEESTPDHYVITYSDAEVSSQTGTLTFQNRNDFDIVVHILQEGETEVVSDKIPAGGCYSFLRMNDKPCTIGVHADVAVNTEIKLFVYDGAWSEPYIVNNINGSLQIVYVDEIPMNVFTAQIPKPANGTIDYVIDDSASARYALFFKDITMEQSEAYIEELKNAGYKNVAGTKEDVAIGVMLQKDDVTLSVACSDEGLGIQIIFANPDSFSGSVSVVGGVDGPKAEAIKTNGTYYNLTEQEKLQVTGSIDSNHSFVQSQMLWTNSTKISIKNNSGTDVTVYLFSVENESTPILEMTLSNKEEKAFTNLSSQYIYYVRISADSSANVSVDISD